MVGCGAALVQSEKSTKSTKGNSPSLSRKTKPGDYCESTTSPRR